MNYYQTRCKFKTIMIIIYCYRHGIFICFLNTKNAINCIMRHNVFFPKYFQIIFYCSSLFIMLKTIEFSCFLFLMSLYYAFSTGHNYKACKLIVTIKCINIYIIAFQVIVSHFTVHVIH